MKEHEVYEAKLEGCFFNGEIEGFRVVWNADCGFGQFDFYLDREEKSVLTDYKLHIDNELMSKDFIKAVLCKMVDDAVLDNTGK